MRGGALAAAVVVCMGWAAVAMGEDWPMFRGPGRDGIAATDEAPLHWSAKQNVQWKIKLPRPGNSSPIVVGDRVFLTCAEDEKGFGRSLYCFARDSGKQLWVRTATIDVKEPTHAVNPYCASTPASDGQRVVAWHGSAGLYCYDLDGKEVWKLDLGAFRHIWGYASSPIIHRQRVYLNCGPGARSFVVAVNLKDGKIAWKSDEPGGADDQSPVTRSWLGSWSSAKIARVEGNEQLLVFQPGRVCAYDLSDGRILWWCGGAGVLAYTDVMVSETSGIGVALAGYGGAGIGFRMGGMGDATSTIELWRTSQKIPQRIGTGVILGRHAFVPNEPGSIACIDITTGKSVWEHRLAGENFWASIVGDSNRLYATSQKGTTYVFVPDTAGWKPLAKNELGEHINATPAICGNQVFIRTWEHLYCIVR